MGSVGDLEDTRGKNGTKRFDGSKRSNILWATVRGAHKNVRRSKRGQLHKPTYAEVVAESEHQPTPANE